MSNKHNYVATLTDNTLTDLLVPGTSKEVSAVSLIIANYEASLACTVEVQLLANNGTTFRCYIIPPKVLSANNAIYLDTKLLLTSSGTPDKIRVKSTKSGGGTNNVSCFVSYDET
jgi:hypothetical protein